MNICTFWEWWRLPLAALIKRNEPCKIQYSSNREWFAEEWLPLHNRKNRYLSRYKWSIMIMELPCLSYFPKGSKSVLNFQCQSALTSREKLLEWISSVAVHYRTGFSPGNFTGKRVVPIDRMEKKNVIFPPPLFNSWVLCLIRPLESWPVLLSAGVHCVCGCPSPQKTSVFPFPYTAQAKVPLLPPRDW